MKSKIIVTTIFIILLTTFSGMAAEKLAVTPEVLNVESLGTPVEFYVNRGETSLKKSQIKSIRMVLEKEGRSPSDYSHMVTTSVATDGKITLIPHPTKFDFGVYTVIITTSYGNASVALHAQLAPGTSPGNPSGRYKVDIQLSPTYYYGSAVNINLELAEGEIYTWIVTRPNGEQETSTQMQNHFSFPAYEVGAYQIAFQATKNQTVVAEWSGSFEVVYEAPIELQYIKKQELKIQAPEGYRFDSCTKNGVTLICPDEATYTEKLLEVGVSDYVFELVNDDPQVYFHKRRLHYIVNTSQK